MKEYGMGDMKPEVKDYQRPASTYAESFDQAPLRYIERQDKRQTKAATKLKSQKYNGRYS